jgi:N-methylhydantoinase B
VTPKGAEAYGVVIRGDLTADVEASRALRDRLRAEHKEIKLFDRGFDSIDELKARCRKETGLEAPRQPQFSHRVAEKKKPSKAA